MSLRILFVSTKYTGHGHHSITEAMISQLAAQSPSTETSTLDGFELGGKLAVFLGKLYGPLTNHARFVWALYYSFCNIFPRLMNHFIAKIIEQNFLTALKRHVPDLIVSVHPAFVGSVNNILKKHQLSIPVIALVADLASINRLWADKRSAYTICPSAEALDKVLSYGIAPEKTVIIGLPLRENFISAAKGITIEALCKKTNRDLPVKKNYLKFLIISGAEGGSKQSKAARILLDNFCCHITLITGRNNKLREKTEKKLLPLYKGRIDVLGFVHNIEDHYLQADILVMRASPNSMMEAVMCCLPFIVIDALPGQEQKNPAFIANNGLGVFCPKLEQLPATVRTLLEKDSTALKNIRRTQFAFRNLLTNEHVADFLLNRFQENRVP